MIHHGDCLEVMRTMPDASVDAIVTDPPYGLGFMGKAWDHGIPAGPFWAEMLRVAKPGGYLLAFGGTRTVHRIATNIEDSGWIIRDMLMWIYASGFPKGKANLKPAWEPIVMARKPGPLRPLAIDECRIRLTSDENVDDREGEPTADTRYGDKVAAKPGRRIIRRTAQPADVGTLSQGERPVGEIASANPSGRWPSNVLLSDPDLFDEPNPWVVGSGSTSTDGVAVRHNGIRPSSFTNGGELPDIGYGGAGGHSRFFIIPKADRADREPVLRGQVERTKAGAMTGPETRPDRPTNHPMRENAHPTVKPTDLMRHLVRLVTPPGGTVLDPFLGSGTTAIACELEGFPWIGIEKEAEYVAIAEARLNGVQRGLGLDVPLAQPDASASSWFTTGYNNDEEPAA